MEHAHRRKLDALQKINELELVGEPKALTRIGQYELAYRPDADRRPAFDRENAE